MDPSAAFDQLSAWLRDMSPMLKSYYDNLIKSGFSDKQAMQLVVNYQTVLLEGVFKNKPE